MNLRTLTLVASTVLLAGAAAFWGQRQTEMETWRERARRAEADVKTETTRRAALEQGLAAAELKAVAAERTAAANRDADAPASSRAAGKKRAAAGNDLAADSNLTSVEQLKQWLADANDPAVVRRLNNEARAWAARRYRDLFTTLALSPQDTDTLTQLFASKRQSGLDVAIASLQQGRDPLQDIGEFRQQMIADHTRIEEEIHARLGDAGYAQYQDFEQNNRATSMLANLETALRSTSEPLSADQTARLKQVFQDNNARRVTDAVLADAGAFLSPAQMRALQDLQALQLANAQKRLQNAAQAGQALPTTPPPPQPVK